MSAMQRVYKDRQKHGASAPILSVAVCLSLHKKPASKHSS